MILRPAAGQSWPATVDSETSDIRKMPTPSDKIESVLQGISPEDFDGVPVNAVEIGVAGPDFAPFGPGYDCGVMAMTGDVLDLRLQSILESRGEWRGRSFAFLYWPEQHHNLQSLVETAIHEAAHFLSGNRLLQTATVDELPNRSIHMSTTRERCEAGERAYAAGAALPKPYASHRWDFTLAAILLGRRAMRTGAIASPGQLTIAGNTFGMSHWVAYDNAVEESFCRTGSIREALQNPPTAFTDLWFQDVERFERFEMLIRAGSWPERFELFDLWMRQIDEKREADL